MINNLKTHMILGAVLLFACTSWLHAADFKIKPVVLRGDLAPDGGTFLSIGGGLPRKDGRIVFSGTTESGDGLYLAGQNGLSLLLTGGSHPISTRLPDPTSLGIPQIACPFGSRECSRPELQALDFFQFPNVNVVTCPKKASIPLAIYGVNESGDMLLVAGGFLQAVYSAASNSIAGWFTCPTPEYFSHVFYSGGFASDAESIGITDLGMVAVTLRATKAGGEKDFPILLLDSAGGLEIINLVGTPAPGGGTIRSVALARINGAGDLLVPFGTSSNPVAPAQGLLLISGGSMVPIAFVGSPAPGGGSFTSFKFSAINDAGQIAFSASLSGGGSGIFRRDPDGTLIALARDSGNRYAGATTFLTINDGGDIAVAVGITEILFLSSNGTLSRIVRQNDPAPVGGSFGFLFSPQVTNKGEVVFFAFLSGGRLGFFIASRGLETEFVDPVPDLLAGPTITSDPDVLAKMGRVVTGIAADGAAQVVVRVKTGQPGTVELSLVDEGGLSLAPSNTNGFLSEVGQDTGSGAVSVTTADVEGTGPMAFAAYHAPVDFASGPDSVEAGLPDRKVFIKVKLTSSTGETVESTQALKIVRPPVVLVHGLWSSKDSWNGFGPLLSDPRFSDDKFLNARIDYAGSNAASFGTNTILVGTKLTDLIRDYKVGKQVGAVQADLVTHSMGGLLARMLPVRSSSFLRDDNFGLGDVHKLINIGTPHFGSELATKLRSKKNRLLCRVAFNTTDTPIDKGAVDDLSPGSEALQVINGFPSNIPMHNNVGIASSLQKEVNVSGFLINTAQSPLVCGRILPAGGFDEIFNGDDSDLMVSATSQRAGLSPSSETVSSFPPLGSNLIHTRAGGVFDVANGEAEQESSKVSLEVIRLLNSSVESAKFFQTSP